MEIKLFILANNPDPHYKPATGNLFFIVSAFFCLFTCSNTVFSAVGSLESCALVKRDCWLVHCVFLNIRSTSVSAHWGHCHCFYIGGLERRRGQREEKERKRRKRESNDKYFEIYTWRINEGLVIWFRCKDMIDWFEFSKHAHILTLYLGIWKKYIFWSKSYLSVKACISKQFLKSIVYSNLGDLCQSKRNQGKE